MEAIFLDCGTGGPQLKRNPLGGSPHTMTFTRRPVRYTLRISAFLAVAFGCGQTRRLPQLPVGFWRLNGDTVAQGALSRGDTGLIVLILPDSSSLAFAREINLEIDPKHDFYHLHDGDLGIDATTLSHSRDSITGFLDAYNMRILATRVGVDPQEFRRQLQCSREQALRHAC